MRIFTLALFLALALSFFYTDAQAQDDPFVNGSFETGDFTGWTVIQEPGSGGDWFVYTGILTPLMSIVPGPPFGPFAAITDQGGPSSQVLFQDIEVPQDPSVECSVIVYYENNSGVFITAPDLSYLTIPNQQARIDILDPSAGDFDVGAGVLLNVFQTNPGDPSSLGYTEIFFDLTPFAGSTVRFRAAEVDNQGVFNFAIDDVRCGDRVAAIPTLGEWGMIAMAGVLGLAGLLFARRRRKLAA
jgi:hypothetical protein